MMRRLVLRLVDGLSGVVPARPLAAARIAFAVAALLQVPLTWTALSGLTDPTLVRLPMFPLSPEPTSGVVAGVMTTWILAAVLFGAGLWTRAAGIALAVALFVAVGIDQQAYSNHAYLMAIIGVLLACADAGAAFSVDAWRRGARATVPRWPIVLMLAQITIVYGFAAATKVNAEFLGGHVIRAVMPHLRLVEAISWKLMVTVSVVLAVGTIVAETALAVGMWRRAWRPALFAVGFLLHAGIATFMSSHLGLSVFALSMFALYLPLVHAEPRSRVVIWDDTCSACAVWVRWFQRVDWFGVHDFQGSSAQSVLDRYGVTQEQADQALQLVTPEGHHTGFAAVGRILEALPLTCWFAALLRLPVVRNVGDRLYARYAMHRSCAVPLLPATDR